MSLIIRNHIPVEITSGKYTARCFAVVHCSNITQSLFLPQLIIGWEVYTKLNNLEMNVNTFAVFDPSLEENTILRIALEQWLEKSFTDAELNKGFALESLLDLPCCLSIKHLSLLDVYENPPTITNIAPLPSTMQCPPLIQKPILFDSERYTEQELLKLPRIILDRIYTWVKPHNVGKYQ